jgi:hypothetical protein
LSSDTPDELHTFHGQNQRNLLSVLLLLACVNAYLLFRVDFEDDFIINSRGLLGSLGLWSFSEVLGE